MREKFSNSRLYSSQLENAKKTNAFALESDNCGHDCRLNFMNWYLMGRMTDK